jgi:hypothetical protein
MPTRVHSLAHLEFLSYTVLFSTFSLWSEHIHCNIVLHIACGVSAEIISSYTTYNLVNYRKVCEISGSHGCEYGHQVTQNDTMHDIKTAAATMEMILIAL